MEDGRVEVSKLLGPSVRGVGFGLALELAVVWILKLELVFIFLGALAERGGRRDMVVEKG